MSYNNLLYLLAVLFILATNTVPDVPPLAAHHTLLIFIIKGLIFHRIVRHSHGERRIKQSSQYFAVEQKLSILAIASVAVDVYLLDCQYYFARIPLLGQLQTFPDLGGVALFFGYLALLWRESVKSYTVAFGRAHRASTFIASNLKTNLPIILPWLILSLISDLLRASPLPAVKSFLASPWGEPALFVLLFLVLAVVFPALIIRLWGCTPLPAGETRSRVEAFCRRQNLAYADILIWPLFEGRMLTAGVMGLTRRFRYLLLTPGLLDTMSAAEVDAVLAHEIGHVKKHHLQLYFLFFIGFMLFAEFSTYPFLYLLLNSDTFYSLLKLTGREPAAALTMLSAAPMFVLMLVYFRYLFGFFMRNFERQADLHIFAAMPDSRHLIQVLEKISWLSGDIRDLPNWHHFGIGQRIRFLIRCEQDRRLIKRHDRMVNLALALFLLAMAAAGVLLWKMPANLLDGAPREKFAQAVIENKINQKPDDPVWHQLLADLQQERKLYPQAIAAYQRTLTLAPDNHEALNNFAWLLLTADPHALRDPARALSLAKRAADLRPHGHILDTLARAYWMTGDPQQAIATELRALAQDPDNAKYYREQIKLFATPPPR